MLYSICMTVVKKKNAGFSQGRRLSRLSHRTGPAEQACCNS